MRSFAVWVAPAPRLFEQPGQSIGHDAKPLEPIHFLDKQLMLPGQ